MIGCLTGCRSCKNTTRCLDCFYPLALKHSKAADTDSCVSDCGLRYYATPSRVCTQCDFRCLSCSDASPNSCPDCDLAVEGVVKTGALSCGCGDGFTASTKLGMCLSIVC